MTAGQVVGILVVMGLAALITIVWQFGAAARGKAQPRDVGLSWLDPEPAWVPPQYFEGWIAEAVARYEEGRTMYSIAVGQIGKDGDPALYDQFLRAAQVQWGAVGGAVGIGRAKSDYASRS